MATKEQLDAAIKQKKLDLAIARKKQELGTRVAPIPEPINQLKRAPTSIPELLGEDTAAGNIFTREMATGLGGVVGTAAGAPAGGPAAPASAFAGGVLGASAGDFAFTSLEDVLRRTGVIQGRTPSVQQQIERRLQEEATDQAVGLALSTVARPVLLTRKALGRIFKITADSKVAQRSAQLMGINLGAADVGGKVPKGIVKVLSVFPFTGTPARRNLAVKEAQVSKAFNDVVNDLAPNGLLTYELGEEFVERARQRFGKFNKVAGRLYQNFDDLATQASKKDIIPTESIRGLANELVQDAIDGKIVLETGEELAPAVKDQVFTTLAALADLPENITLPQHRRLNKELKILFDVVEKAGGNIRDLGRMKSSLDIDLNNLDVSQLPEGEGRKILKALETANSFYTQQAARLETSVAQKFGRVDKNIFRQGFFKPGSVTPQQTADVILSLRSPDAIDQLRDVVGTNAMKDAARAHLENSLKLATEEIDLAGQLVEATSPSLLKRELGITSKKGREIAGLKKLLEIADIDFGDFTRLLDAAEALEKAGDPSTFIKRRVTLGGARAALGAAGFGAALGTGAAQAGPVSIITGTFLARKLTDIATNPIALKNMITALDTQLATAARRLALGRAITAVNRDQAEKNRRSQSRRPSPARSGSTSEETAVVE